MATTMVQGMARAAWELARRQHDVVTREQLLAIGFSSAAIRHRVDRGRLCPVYRGVYAVGRPTLSLLGRWMAAVLACGPGAGLSHRSGGALLGVAREGAIIEVSVPAARRARHAGVRVRRRASLELTTHRGIPVTTPVHTLVDLAAVLDPRALERAVNEADRLDLVDPEALRRAAAVDRRPGAAKLRALLDRDTFVLTESELERRYLALAARAGLPAPATQVELDGFRTDFHYPELDLVVETDGLRYHRTPAQQARDRLRDQEHAAAGRTTLRFTHAQVARDRAHVERILRAVSARIAGSAPASGRPRGRSAR